MNNSHIVLVNDKVIYNNKVYKRFGTDCKGCVFCSNKCYSLTRFKPRVNGLRICSGYHRIEMLYYGKSMCPVKVFSSPKVARYGDKTVYGALKPGRISIFEASIIKYRYMKYIIKYENYERRKK